MCVAWQPAANSQCTLSTRYLGDPSHAVSLVTALGSSVCVCVCVCVCVHAVHVCVCVCCVSVCQHIRHNTIRECSALVRAYSIFQSFYKGKRVFLSFGLGLN